MGIIGKVNNTSPIRSVRTIRIFSGSLRENQFASNILDVAKSCNEEADPKAGALA